MAKHRNPVFKPLFKFAIYAAVCLVLLFTLAARVGNLTPPTHKRTSTPRSCPTPTPSSRRRT